MTSTSVGPSPGSSPAASPGGVGHDLLAALRAQLPLGDEVHRARAPFTGADLPGVPLTTGEQVASVAAPARAAQITWAASPSGTGNARSCVSAAPCSSTTTCSAT